MLTRDDLAALDREDSLAGFRDAFALPEGVIYLDGNSLGPLPASVAARVARVIEREWGDDLITSWNVHDWIGLPMSVGDKIARLVGGGEGNVVCADGTSVNLFKLLAAVLPLRPGRKVILSDTGNFPTDLYVARRLAELRLVEPDEVETTIGEETAVVMLTEVDYRTGRKHDMARITKAAHRAGALALWDLCHSAGVLPVDLLGDEVDLAVGCTYKYLSGGPGAPAYLFVAPPLQERLESPLAGWMGHDAPFAFDPAYRPAQGVRRMLCGTPPILAMAALDAALDVILAADMAAVRAKSARLTTYFIELIEGACEGLGFEVITPREAEQRGSQVSVRHANAYPVMAALIDRGVIGDVRAPDIMRFGLAPLTVRYVDLWDAIETLRAIMAEASWDRPRYHARAAVT